MQTDRAALTLIAGLWSLMPMFQLRVGGGPQHAALPDAAAAFFDQALSTDRTRRPASPLEFLAACEKVLA